MTAIQDFASSRDDLEIEGIDISKLGYLEMPEDLLNEIEHENDLTHLDMLEMPEELLEYYLDEVPEESPQVVIEELSIEIESSLENTPIQQNTSAKQRAVTRAKQVYSTLKGLVKDGANKIPIYRRVKQGIENAQSAYQQKIEKVNPLAVIEDYKHLKKNPIETYKQYQNLMDTQEYQSWAMRYSGHLAECGVEVTKGWENLSAAEFLQKVIETHGVGPTKISQILSNMEDLMENLEKQYPNLKEAITRTRTDCTPSRTVEEAQKVVDESFPGKGYVIVKQMGAASMGETYKVKRADGSYGILKLLKKGVDAKQLELEEEYYTMLIKSYNPDPTAAQKQIDKIHQLYTDWADELSFESEVAANKRLAQGAKRYTVADATDLSDDGHCMVMDIARGVKMADLVKYLKFYTEHPDEYFTKYAKKIEEFPFLANPEKLITETPTAIMKAFNEQFMFLKDGGKSLMHGDPHTGNYFIYVNEKGEVIPEFIDTGLCIERTGDQVKEDINFFTNYFVGNSTKVAEYYIDRCSNVSEEDRPILIEQIGEDIKREIFNQQQNITEFSVVLGKIDSILDSYGLVTDPKNATALKAEMQFFTGIGEIGSLSGKSFDIGTVIKDIPKASWYMMKNGENPWSSIAPALKYFYHNQEQSLSTAYQFKIKK